MRTIESKKRLHGDFRADRAAHSESVLIPVTNGLLEGELVIPAAANGIVLFAHGSGSSRLSPRNRYVAQVLAQWRLGTLLFDLLTDAEGTEDTVSHRFRFDIGLLSERLIEATHWVKEAPEVCHYPVAYFGSSTGAAAALVAAARLGELISAVVSRGGRPDLAAKHLPDVVSPTMLIVGGYDNLVIRLNQDALAQLRCERKFIVIPRSTHLFEEPGALERVADTAATWFRQHFGPAPAINTLPLPRRDL
jgi:pimeloyl-ACP methyl ester carboxylesterase